MRLKPTGEDILADENAKLGHLILDEKGNLAVVHDSIRKILMSCVTAVNILYERVLDLEAGKDDVSYTLEALKQASSKSELRMQDLEDTSRELRIQVGTIVTTSLSQEADSDKSKQDGNQGVSGETITMMMESLEQVKQNLDALEEAHFDFKEKYDGDIIDMDETIKSLQDYMEETLERRLVSMDDVMTSQKLDLDALRNNLHEVNARKASKADFAELEKKLDDCLEEQKTEQEVLKQAHKSLEKLDDCYALASANKSRIQELTKIVQEETQELRDWSSRNFQELKAAIQVVAADHNQSNAFEEMRTQVREGLSGVVATCTMIDNTVRQKAEAAEVQKLRESLVELSLSIGKPKQLLMGTKCLACNRETDADATEEFVGDQEKQYQQELLYNEVQKALDGAQKDDLKYLSVHIGTQARVRPSDGGPGHIQVRNSREASPGGWRLVRSLPPSRPGTGAVSAAAPGYTSEGLPPRSPPREVPPLVRVRPRVSAASGAAKWFEGNGVQSMSLKTALGGKTAAAHVPTKPGSAGRRVRPIDHFAEQESHLYAFSEELFSGESDRQLPLSLQEDH
eukprot:TRINITY_DN74613_c0_g1_i1.p1 TRINITY_DN74613_c0_g1~~TRINITY_DN74613_c0_g1_i1.p1  ORF type:complete len:570 (-),score=160.60 TRINITY_DN74613_c0_g1_i1:95-1804(-)